MDKEKVKELIERIDFIAHDFIDRPRKGWCPDEFLGKEYFVISFK